MRKLDGITYAISNATVFLRYANVDCASCIDSFRVQSAIKEKKRKRKRNGRKSLECRHIRTYTYSDIYISLVQHFIMVYLSFNEQSSINEFRDIFMSGGASQPSIFSSETLWKERATQVHRIGGALACARAALLLLISNTRHRYDITTLRQYNQPLLHPAFLWYRPLNNRPYGINLLVFALQEIFNWPSWPYCARTRLLFQRHSNTRFQWVLISATGSRW